MGYETDITKDQILLAILKLVANNNAMLQIVLENQLEMRKSLVKIEGSVDDGKLNEAMKPVFDELSETVRKQIEELKNGVESKAIREAYEWAFMNDPDAFDFSILGLED